MVPLIEPLGMDVAGPLVYGAYAKWSDIAITAFNNTQSYVNSIGSFQITPVTFEATFNPQIALPGFPTITPPVVPTAALEYNAPPMPAQPPAFDSPPYSPTAAPQFDVQAPAYQPPAVPQLATLTSPGAAPTLTDVAIPAAPDIELPPLPSLADLQVPQLPQLAIPTFSAVAPTFNVPVPTENFSFQPGQYVDSLLDQTKGTLSQMMNGDFVLPAAVANALRNRAYESANLEAARAEDDTFGEFAARGFEEPSGLLYARLAAVREKAQMARMGINRDVYAQDQQVALENLRAAVSGGIQLEGELIQLFTTTTQLQFDAAKFSLDVALQIFQARIAQYNAQVQAFGVQAEAYRDQIQGALAQAQIYSAEIEGLRVQGELNMQKVQLYNAQLEGIKTMVATYQAQVGAAEAVSRVNVSMVEAYSAQVGAFRTEVEAQTAQWQGYKAQVDAQLGNVQFYNTAVNAYGQRVQAWATGERASQEVVQLRIEQNKAHLASWQATAQLFEEQMKAELTRITTVKDTFEAQVESFKGQAEVATAAGEYDNRRFQLNLAQEQAIVDTSLKRSEAGFEQMRYITSSLLEVKKTIATIQSQLAASAMNTVHLGGQVSTYTGTNLGWSTNVSFSGSTEDI